MRSYKSFIEDFCEIRQYIEELINDKLLSFRSGIWDTQSKYIIIHEINLTLKKEIKDRYPEMPERFYPKIKYQVNKTDFDMDVVIQNYLNTDHDMKYLGTREIDSVVFDFYIKQYDRFNHSEFIAKYGHDDSCKFTGSHTIADDYKHGIFTPLSVAYELGIEYGYVK